ncbi:MAG: N-acetyltransferase [Taibaiella sp.]|nr:N-acetyltransferase [Taibaiella sp.]
MDVKQKNAEAKGWFYIEYEGKEIAAMHYVWAGTDKMIIDHTEVDEAYEGRGLGKQLVHAGVAYARANDVKIIPLCPFAKGVFDRVEAYRDVLAS